MQQTEKQIDGRTAEKKRTHREYKKCHDTIHKLHVQINTPNAQVTALKAHYESVQENFERKTQIFNAMNKSPAVADLPLPKKMPEEGIEIDHRE